MEDTDIAWNQFIRNNGILKNPEIKPLKKFFPKFGPIYISTKTKIGFLNTPINLNQIFWLIKVIPYYKSFEGVIKKQMKTVCCDINENKKLDEKITKETEYVNVETIYNVNNPNARKIKYKDVRKINVGLCKKDLIAHRIRKKGAFYNCIVLIVRLKIQDKFKEFHLKIFNTGKLEIPGIQHDEDLYMLLDKVVNIIQPNVKTKIQYKKEEIDTVLINSNFSCGFFINRTILYKILKFKYKLHTIFDSCSYPGIQCKFYYNELHTTQDGVCRCPDKCNKKGNGRELNKCLEISFMIFRTGSALIVGHCTEPVLLVVYEFIKKILSNECDEIRISSEKPVKKNKTKKVRKKIILIE